MRKQIHFRRIEMRGYSREDGLYEVEGRVVDTKPFAFTIFNGTRVVFANEPIHDMGLRLVYDDQLVVHEVHPFTDSAPYPVCHGGGAALQTIIGLTMSSGWNKEVRRRLGGVRSCTHLMELLMPMATTAFQTLTELRMSQPDKLDADGRPLKIDSCFAYAAEGELVRRQWPQFYRAPPTDAGE